MAMHYSKTCLNKQRRQPRRIAVQTGHEWVMEKLARPKSCYKMFRMYPDVFLSLHGLLVSDYHLESTSEMNSLESLGMFLWMLGGPQSFRQAEDRFVRSTETIHRKFNHVLHCVNSLGGDIIKPRDPTFADVHPKIRDKRFWPHFKGCIGAIDGTHIPVIVPAKETCNYMGRHSYTSQNVLAVCDFDMRFTFVVAGWAGSVHDTRIFHHSILKYAATYPAPPEGTQIKCSNFVQVVCINLYTCSNLFSMDVDMYYLVDSGYPNRVGYLAPYKGTTYHLAEFRSVRRPPSGKFEVFNYLHSSLRNVIERTFGVLKQKWRILRDVPHFKVGSQTMIISACMTLHNFIRDSKLRDKEFDKCDDNENHMPAVSRSTPLLGDVVPTSSDEGNMNDTRDRIASSLFIARQAT
nr:protein ALP1-like isoform X3 [Aegilops tauschii subsp. strangulata]